MLSFSGDVIPDIEYTKEDIETWNGVYQKVKKHTIIHLSVR